MGKMVMKTSGKHFFVGKKIFLTSGLDAFRAKAF